MRRFPQRFVLSGAACALLVTIGLAAWALAAGSSGAQAGSMHNCPQTGRWSIAVWEGQSGTAAADALATCGAGAVDAAYALDPQTGSWSRWFAGLPEASNMPPFSDIQGVLALGGAAAAGAAGAEGLGAQAGGQLRNCPQAGKWSIAVWDGQDGTAVADALGTCGAGAVDAAYALDPQTGSWSRWFAALPEASNMPPFSHMQGVLALGAATGGQTSEPTSGWWVAVWTEDGADLSVQYTRGTGKLSEYIRVHKGYSPVGVPVEGSETTGLRGEDIYGRELDIETAKLSGWHAQLKPDSVVASGIIVYPPTTKSEQSSFTRTLKVTVHYEYDNQGRLTGGTGSEEFVGIIPGGIAYSGTATGTFAARHGDLVWTERVEKTSYYVGDAPYAEAVTVITPESQYLGGEERVVRETVKTTTAYADGGRRESEIVILWQRDEHGVCTGKSGSGVVSGTEIIDGQSVDYAGSITIDYGFDSHIGWYKTGYGEKRSAEAQLPKRLPLEVIFIDDPYLRPVF